jgi:type III restriction enzyme
LSATDDFFKRPILNSPYAYPARHWELDDQGQPTQLVMDSRRKAEFKSPIPKPRKQKGKAKQTELDLVSDDQLSTANQTTKPPASSPNSAGKSKSGASVPTPPIGR